MKMGAGRVDRVSIITLYWKSACDFQKPQNTGIIYELLQLCGSNVERCASTELSKWVTYLLLLLQICPSLYMQRFGDCILIRLWFFLCVILGKGWGNKKKNSSKQKTALRVLYFPLESSLKTQENNRAPWDEETIRPLQRLSLNHLWPFLFYWPCWSCHATLGHIHQLSNPELHFNSTPY